MQRTAPFFAALSLLAAQTALAQSPPSSAHPRLFMSAGDVAAYTADASRSGSPSAHAIADCQRVLDHPEDQTTRGGSDGSTWPAAAMSCAFAWKVTGDAMFLSTAISAWHAALDDDQTRGDHLGCVSGVDTSWQTWADGDRSTPAPPVILTVTHDTGYPIRWYGPFVALTYDWLHDAPGVDDSLRAQTRTCLTAWVDYYAQHGYHHDEAGANYGAGFTLAQALTAIAIGTDGGTDAHLMTGAVSTYRDVLIAEGLANASGTGPAGPLVGGDWLEGWQYGPLSVLEYALGARVLSDFGASLPEMSDWMNSVIVRHIHGTVPAGDGVWTGGGDFDDSDHLYPTPARNVLDAVLVGPSSDTAASYAASLADADYGGGFPVYAAFASRRAVTPVDYTSTMPATWFLSRGSRAIYARTSWDASAYWMVFTSAGALVDDHEHYAASNFVLTHGADHLIVDTSQYGAPNSLETNALTTDSPQLVDHYAMTQTPWSEAELVWARVAEPGVVAARSDIASAFAFASMPSDIPYAHREWVFLPEGLVVLIDRVHTADASHAMHVRLHMNTAGHATLAGARASGVVGASRVEITALVPAGAAPRIDAPEHLGDSSTCTTGWPSGDCSDARMPVDIYALDVPGPYATAVHVVDGTEASTAAATIGSIGDAPYDDAGSNAGVVGAAVFAGTHQSYVLASSAHDGMTGATMTYSVPATSPSRHVVFDAPEASDGSSSVAVTAMGDRCAITITAGSGGGIAGHPLMFAIDSASSGCTVTESAEVMPGTPPMGGFDAGPRADGGTSPPEGGSSGGCCQVAGTSGDAGVMTLLVAGLIAVVGRRRVRG